MFNHFTLKCEIIKYSILFCVFISYLIDGLKFWYQMFLLNYIVFTNVIWKYRNYWIIKLYHMLLFWSFWKVLIVNMCFTYRYENRLLKNLCLKFRPNVTKSSTHNINKSIFETVSLFFKPRNSLCTSITLIASYSGCRGLNLSSIHVHCKQSKFSKTSSDAGFDWKRFLDLVWPDLWVFLGAVLVSYWNMHINYYLENLQAL